MSTLPALLIPDSQPVQYNTDCLSKIYLHYEKFFLSPPAADLSDTVNYKYPTPIIACPITTLEEKQAIIRFTPFKAPQPTLIPNVVLQNLEPFLLPLLQYVFNRSLELGYYAKLFWDLITIAIQNPQKDNYTLVKAYHPIALLDIIGNTFESIFARRISVITEIYHLLPDTHFGRKRNTLIEYAIHFLIKKIYTAWNRGEKTSALMLNITRVFDNVSQPRLIHNLRKRQLKP